MPPTLLGLPRELRDAIYENLTETHVINHNNNSLDLKALPSGTRKYTHGTLSLMRTNRTLRTELQEHIRQFETYCVSQRYRAFAGLNKMTLWKPAPVPPSARKLYLRVYIAITTRLARKTADNSLLSRMNISAASLQEPVLEDRGADDFAVLNAVLRDCYHLEELVVELVVRGQETIFGQGLESLDRNQHTKAVAGLGISAMEREIQKLPCLRRYAIVVDRETKFTRRNVGEQWTRQCLIPSCVPTCHCYGAFGATCVEDSMDLFASLTPCAANEWLSCHPDGDLELGS